MVIFFGNTDPSNGDQYMIICSKYISNKLVLKNRIPFEFVPSPSAIYFSSLDSNDGEVYKRIAYFEKEAALSEQQIIRLIDHLNTCPDIEFVPEANLHQNPNEELVDLLRKKAEKLSKIEQLDVECSKLEFQISHLKRAIDKSVDNIFI